jgi:hypothetical protein
MHISFLLSPLFSFPVLSFTLFCLRGTGRLNERVRDREMERNWRGNRESDPNLPPSSFSSPFFCGSFLLFPQSAKHREIERFCEGETQEIWEKPGENPSNLKVDRVLEDDRGPDPPWVVVGDWFSVGVADRSFSGKPRYNFQWIRAGLPAIFNKIFGGLKSNFRWGDFVDFGNF